MAIPWVGTPPRNSGKWRFRVYKDLSTSGGDCCWVVVSSYTFKKSFVRSFGRFLHLSIVRLISNPSETKIPQKIRPWFASASPMFLKWGTETISMNSMAGWRFFLPDGLYKGLYHPVIQGLFHKPILRILIPKLGFNGSCHRVTTCTRPSDPALRPGAICLQDLILKWNGLEIPEGVLSNGFQNPFSTGQKSLEVFLGDLYGCNRSNYGLTSMVSTNI